MSVVRTILHYLCSLSGVISKHGKILEEVEPSLFYQVARFLICLTFNTFTLVITESIVYDNFFNVIKGDTKGKNSNMMYFMSDSFLHNSKIFFIIISASTSFWRWRKYYNLIAELASIRSVLMFSTNYRGRIFFIIMFAFLVVTFFYSSMKIETHTTIVEHYIVIPNIIVQISIIQFIFTFYEINMILTNAFHEVNMKLEEIFAKISNSLNVEINLCVDQRDLQIINSLRNLSEKLRGAMELTNDIFGLQILAATFDIFLNIVITPYFLYLDLKTISSSEFVFMISKEGKVFWTISNILKLVFIFLPCAATTNEAKKTSFILCKLLNEDLQSGVKKELTTFLLQLLSSHKRMGFSASGMFELNLSSIISVAGAVTTYLVVLIQFQSA